jgi:hypothetical protein
MYGIIMYDKGTALYNILTTDVIVLSITYQGSMYGIIMHYTYKYYISSLNLRSQGLIVRHYGKLHRYKYDIKRLPVYHLKLSLNLLLRSEHISQRPVSELLNP